jgi:hypothetical protein
MKRTLVLLFVLLIACSETEDGIVELQRTDSWETQIVQNDRFNNEVSSVVTNQDYQIASFSNHIEGSNTVVSQYYKNNSSELFAYYGNDNGTILIYPVSNNQVSPFGFQITLTDSEIGSINLIENNISENSYAAIASLYDLNPSRGITGKTFSKKECKDIYDDAWCEVYRKISVPFIGLLIDLKEIKKKLEELPNDIREKLGEWFNDLKELGNDISQYFKDLTHYSDGDNIDEKREERNEEDFEVQPYENLKEETNQEYEFKLTNQIRFLDTGTTLYFFDSLEVAACDNRTVFGINYEISCNGGSALDADDTSMFLFTETDDNGENLASSFSFQYAPLQMKSGVLNTNLNIQYTIGGFRAVGNLGYVYKNDVINRPAQLSFNSRANEISKSN